MAPFSMPVLSGGQADTERAAEAAAQKIWVPAPQLAKELGICRRTLARWLREIPTGFPRPIVVRDRLSGPTPECRSGAARAQRPNRGVR